MKPKSKETCRKDAIIKVKTLLKVTENPKGCFTNNEEMMNISIDKHGNRCSCSFASTKKGKKELLKFIKEELYF